MRREFTYDQKGKAQLRAYVPTLPVDGTIKIIITDNVADRSGKQNRLSHLWYATRSVDTGLGADEEKCYCKLMFGVPILIEEDEEFASFFDEALRGLPYDKLMEAMKFVPVTSIMTVKQMTRYLHDLDQASAEVGIILPRPEDIYEEAMGRRRKREQRDNGDAPAATG